MENPEWATAAARVKAALVELGSAARVVVTDGSARTAAEAAQTLGCDVGAIEQVREATGQQVGGVAPVGHPARVETVIDRDLGSYPDVWVAAGTPCSVFRTDLDELVRLTGGAVVQVD